MIDLDYTARKAELTDSLQRARDAGVSTAYVECGQESYQLLTAMALARVPIAEVDYARRQIEAGALELTFCGVRVIKCPDVPERRLWPPRAISAIASERRLSRDMVPKESDDATGFREA